MNSSARAHSTYKTAAQLVFDFTDDEGNDVPATFINLLEPPNDDRVVVLARLSHAHSRVGAVLKPKSDQSGAANFRGEIR